MTTITIPQPLVIYGAGGAGADALVFLRSLGAQPVCFCDKNPSKQGKKYFGLPVLSLSDVKSDYPDFYMYVALNPQYRYEVFYTLVKEDVPKEKIINFEETEYRRSCKYLEGGLNVTIDSLQCCCMPQGINNGDVRIPTVKIQTLDFNDNLNKCIDELQSLSQSIINELHNPNAVTYYCHNCSAIHYGYFPVKRKISVIIMSQPRNCNADCIYCGNETWKSLTDEYRLCMSNFNYREFFGKLSAKGLLRNGRDLYISMASGEITIDPNRTDILDIFEDNCYNGFFSTTGILFNEQIARIANARSPVRISVSVDAGTSETYRKIKNVDAFDIVWKNIRRYTDSGANFIAKYIFLPENANFENVSKFITLCVKSNIREISISSDSALNRQGIPLPEFMLKMAMKMAQLAYENNIRVGIREEMFHSAEDVKQIYAAAKELAVPFD